MKSSTAWLGLPLAALIAACGGDTAQDDIDFADTPPAVPTTEQPPLAGAGNPTAMAETAEIQELGGSGVSGEATIRDRGTQTEVMVRLEDTPANTTMPGHIHTGTCDNVGSVVQPLQEIATDASGTGSMTATVDIQAMSVMDGQHIVVYHGEGGTPAACAQIPTHAM